MIGVITTFAMLRVITIASLTDMAWPLGAGGCSLAVDLLQLVFSSCHTKAHQKLLLEVILAVAATCQFFGTRMVQALLPQEVHKDYRVGMAPKSFEDPDVTIPYVKHVQAPACKICPFLRTCTLLWLSLFYRRYSTCWPLAGRIMHLCIFRCLTLRSARPGPLTPPARVIMKSAGWLGHVGSKETQALLLNCVEWHGAASYPEWNHGSFNIFLSFLSLLIKLYL